MVPTGYLRFWGKSQAVPRCVLIRSETLTQQLIKYAVNLPPGKDRERGVIAFSLCTEPWEDGHSECVCSY